MIFKNPEVGRVRPERLTRKSSAVSMLNVTSRKITSAAHRDRTNSTRRSSDLRCDQTSVGLSLDITTCLRAVSHFLRFSARPDIVGLPVVLRAPYLETTVTATSLDWDPSRAVVRVRQYIISVVWHAATTRLFRVARSVPERVLRSSLSTPTNSAVSRRRPHRVHLFGRV